MTQDEKLIPDLQEWRKFNGPNFSIDSWTAIKGNIKLAIGYSFLFWPEFIEHENCVFLKSHFSIDTFKHWQNPNHIKNYAGIESMINHIHIVDLFATASTPPRQSLIHRLFKKAEKDLFEKPSKEQIIYLGNKLVETYRAKLVVEYPNKKFDISFDYVDNPENLEDYQLTFWQPDNENREIK